MHVKAPAFGPDVCAPNKKVFLDRGHAQIARDSEADCADHGAQLILVAQVARVGFRITWIIDYTIVSSVGGT
jgi:hypothetical protein